MTTITLKGNAIETSGELPKVGGTVAFQQHRLRIDPRAQALVALLRHSLSRHVAEAFARRNSTVFGITMP